MRLDSSDNDTLSLDTIRVCTTRKVTVSECAWLREDIPAGKIFFVASDPYRVCSPSGIPVHKTESNGYFELPIDAVVGIIE